jgi:hypothetical protein
MAFGCGNRLGGRRGCSPFERRSQWRGGGRWDIPFYPIRCISVRLNARHMVFFQNPFPCHRDLSFETEFFNMSIVEAKQTPHRARAVPNKVARSHAPRAREGFVCCIKRWSRSMQGIIIIGYPLMQTRDRELSFQPPKDHARSDYGRI